MNQVISGRGKTEWNQIILDLIVLSEKIITIKILTIIIKPFGRQKFSSTHA